MENSPPAEAKGQARILTPQAELMHSPQSLSPEDGQVQQDSSLHQHDY